MGGGTGTGYATGEYMDAIDRMALKTFEICGSKGSKAGLDYIEKASTQMLKDYRMFCALQDCFGVDPKMAHYIIFMAKYGYSVKEIDNMYGIKRLPAGSEIE